MYYLQVIDKPNDEINACIIHQDLKILTDPDIFNIFTSFAPISKLTLFKSIVTVKSLDDLLKSMNEDLSIGIVDSDFSSKKYNHEASRFLKVNELVLSNLRNYSTSDFLLKYLI